MTPIAHCKPQGTQHSTQKLKLVAPTQKWSFNNENCEWNTAYHQAMRMMIIKQITLEHLGSVNKSKQNMTFNLIVNKPNTQNYA